MSKVSRALAVPQGVFTLLTVLLALFCGLNLGRAYGSLGFVLLALALSIAAVKALMAALRADCDGMAYRVIQAVLMALHLAALIYCLAQGMPLIDPETSEVAVTLFQGFNAGSLYWLAYDLTPLGHLLALVFGLVPLVAGFIPRLQKGL